MTPNVDPIPSEFESYEAAAAFWDTHDTMDYPDMFETVTVEVQLQRRHFEVEIEEDITNLLRQRARKRHISLRLLTNQLLRQHLTA